MSGAQHTPGPWTIEQYGAGDSLVVHSDADTRVCFMATPGLLGSLPNIKANARLIAAAPDMLAAIKVVDDVETARLRHVGLNDEGIAEHPVVKMLRAAIAKAEGRS